MSLRFASEQLAALRHDGELLTAHAAGTFSKQLVYRLTVIHPRACDEPVYAGKAGHFSEAHVYDLSQQGLPR